jgi:large subunit ribosomal protein L21
MMRYAIVESGGKQYKAVEGMTIEVDRLPEEEGKQIRLERVLLMADGTEFHIGAPTLGDVEVKATVVDHFSGPKLIHFRYRPKKRIRVKSGHRQQYTRLSVDFIGARGDDRNAAKAKGKSKPEAQPPAKPPAKAVAKKVVKKTAAGRKTASATKTAAKKSTK